MLQVPSVRVERVLEEVVEEALHRHGGGTSYFDYLDEQLRRPEFFEALTDKVVKDFGHLPSIVVTGKFGEAYRVWHREGWLKYFSRRGAALLLFDGGLRHDPNIEMQPWALVGRRYVLLDDSFWMGRTRSAVATSLHMGGAHLLGTYVLYDGSTTPGISPDFALYTYRTEKGQ